MTLWLLIVLTLLGRPAACSLFSLTQRWLTKFAVAPLSNKTRANCGSLPAPNLILKDIAFGLVRFAGSPSAAAAQSARFASFLSRPAVPFGVLFH
jgi:hypothetical protein